MSKGLVNLCEDVENALPSRLMGRLRQRIRPSGRRRGWVGEGPAELARGPEVQVAADGEERVLGGGGDVGGDVGEAVGDGMTSEAERA